MLTYVNTSYQKNLKTTSEYFHENSNCKTQIHCCIITIIHFITIIHIKSYNFIVLYPTNVIIITL